MKTRQDISLTGHLSTVEYSENHVWYRSVDSIWAVEGSISSVFHMSLWCFCTHEMLMRVKKLFFFSSLDWNWDCSNWDCFGQFKKSRFKRVNNIVLSYMGSIDTQMKKKDFALDISNNDLIINQTSGLCIILAPKSRPGGVGSGEGRSEDEWGPNHLKKESSVEFWDRDDPAHLRGRGAVFQNSEYSLVTEEVGYCGSWEILVLASS